MKAPQVMPQFEPVRVLVTNHAGVTAARRISPIRIRHGICPPWHNEPGWLLQAFDHDRGAHRNFALDGLRAWGAPAVGTALLARSATKLAAELLTAVQEAKELLAQIPNLDGPAHGAFELLAEAEAAALLGGDDAA